MCYNNTLLQRIYRKNVYCNHMKKVCFDLGGVIISRGLWKFREQLCDTYGISDELTKQAFFGDNYNKYFSGQMSEESYWKTVIEIMGIEADWFELRTQLLNCYELHHEMIAMIQKLRERGVMVFLQTDQTNEWWNFLDEKFLISEQFDRVILSSEIGYTKRSSEFYEVLRTTITNENDSAPLFVDDLEENCVRAQEHGFETFLFVDENSCVEFLQENYL